MMSWNPMILAHLYQVMPYCYPLMYQTAVCVQLLKKINRDSSARKGTFDSNRCRFHKCSEHLIGVGVHISTPMESSNQSLVL